MSAGPSQPIGQLGAEFHLNLLGALQGLMVVLIVALFVLTFLAQPFRIPSESMEPTLLIGDFVLVDKVATAPGGGFGWLLPYRGVHRGDVIVFHSSGQAQEPGSGNYLVKRVAGVPGDHLRLQNGRLLLNGALQAEPYALFLPSGPDAYRDAFPRALYADAGVEPRWWVEMRQLTRDGELVVPEDAYFVLGDNRNHSFDSRYWGFVERDQIIGSALVIYFSLRTPSPDGGDQAAAPAGAGASATGGRMSESRDFARWQRIFRVVR